MTSSRSSPAIAAIPHRPDHPTATTRGTRRTAARQRQPATQHAHRRHQPQISQNPCGHQPHESPGLAGGVRPPWLGAVPHPHAVGVAQRRSGSGDIADPMASVPRPNIPSPAAFRPATWMGLRCRGRHGVRARTGDKTSRARDRVKRGSTPKPAPDRILITKMIAAPRPVTALGNRAAGYVTGLEDECGEGTANSTCRSD